MATRPAKFPEWATSGTNTTEPTLAKKASGWLPGEAPPAQIFNWLHTVAWRWLQYLDEKDSYTYLTPQARHVLVWPGSAWNLADYDNGATVGFELDSACGIRALDASARAKVPIIRLPTGAVLKSIDVLVTQTTAATMQFDAIVSQPVFAPAALGGANLATRNTNPTTGLKLFNLPSPSGAQIDHTIDNAAEMLYLLCVAGAVNDQIHAIRVNFFDPGPRNH